MKSILFITLLLFISSCNPPKKGSIFINKMGKDTVFTINTHKNRPTTLKIHIVGFSNDTFSINNSIIHGKKIDDSLDLDWYTSELKITYKHMKADSGQIRINYALY